MDKTKGFKVYETGNTHTLANYLEKMRGSRSINKWAEDTKISAIRLSRYLRGLMDLPLSINEISILEGCSEIQITEDMHNQLLIAAGYK